MGWEQLLASLGGAGIGALVGGNEPPGLTPEQRRIWHMLIQRYQAEHRYSNSPTLSTPVERQSLAQAQGLQSEAAGRSRQGLFGQQGVNELAAGNAGAQARGLSNLGAAEQAQSSNIYAQFAQQGLQDRNNVRHNTLPALLGQAGNIAGNPAQAGQDNGWGAIMPMLQQAAYQYGYRPQSGGSTGTSFARGPGNGGTPGGTGFEPAQTGNLGQQSYVPNGWENWQQWPNTGGYR